MNNASIFLAALLVIPGTVNATTGSAGAGAASPHGLPGHGLPENRLPEFSQIQGLEGNVYLIAGNQMPSPNRKTAAPNGVRAIVCIYELTNGNQVTRQGQKPYYSAIATKKIGQVETDAGGHFSVSLPPGRYSVFVKKGTRFYAYGSDIHNNIAPAEVTAGRMTMVECRVEGDRPAVY